MIPLRMVMLNVTGYGGLQGLFAEENHAPQVARQATKLAAQFCLAEQCAQPVVPVLEQIFANVAEKVKVTSRGLHLICRRCVQAATWIRPVPA
jgi:hypothetical protein